MNWGKWIFVAFVLFAGFIGTLVTVCVRQDISLVSRNYYQEELQYQSQIARISNTGQLHDKPAIKAGNGVLEISYSAFASLENGKLMLFRPSNGKLDQQFDVPAMQGSVQRIDVSNLPGGRYKAKLSWSSEGKEYYLENDITL